MRRFAKLVPVLAIFGTIATISAAPGPTPTPAPGAGSSSAPAKIMSVGEMNVAAAAIDVRLEDDTQQVMRLQELAKKQKDVIKLNCVNDRIVEIKAQRNIADDARTHLNTSLAKNGDDRQSLFDSLNSVADNVRSLREQAQSCIGVPELYKQESGVTVDRPDVPDDPTVNPPSIDTGVEPPGYASPWD